MKISKIQSSGSLDVKRCYLPFEVTSACPECGQEETIDLSLNYLSYPCLGENGICFWHPFSDDDEEECQHEWEETVVLGFTMEQV